MDEALFNEYVLANMPYFIAVNYQRLLDAREPQERVEWILHIYNLGLRALTINLVNQYLNRDREDMQEPYLDDLLYQRFRHLTPDGWKDMLFTTLKAYKGNRDRLFMPELYDFYWDTSAEPHRRRDEVKPPFERLTQATVEILMKQLVPQDESGWKALAEELQVHLQHILHSLSFIGKYDLIYVLHQDEHSYTFELHKGTYISIDRGPLPTPTLETGCFYLRSRTEDFLLLDPWLVFGEWKSESNVPTSVSMDTGIFERLGYAHLWYLLAASGQTREGDKSIREFIELIYNTIANVKIKLQEAEKLSWVQLCVICEDITERRMATVRGKYHKELYLQRDKARQQVEAFLADPKKRGFVLVGKSGVGKSNFLLALVEKLQQSRDDLCVLMYDGANLPVASSSLTEIISQDFSERVPLFRQPVQQVWHEITRIDGIEEHLVVLCVDAINENPQATELLRQLDALIQGPWPWLKIVLSSRPETWQSIKRGVKLSETLYYQEPGTELLGVKLEPFSYSEQMEPFTPQELPEVYSKYQREFQLQTPYEALSHEVREMLRDPLQLWLLAKTYEQQAIPENVKVSKLIELYVKKKFLEREDRRFLEERLVSLMIREDHYSKAITEAGLDAAGDALYEMVYSNQVLSNGRRMNQSFLNLSDANILVLQEQGFEQQIAFKYERFYEYFAGKRIVSLSETQADRYAYFLGLIEEATRKPFLWGAVRNALVQVAKDCGSELLLKLCFTDQQRVKEMMVSVLTYLGWDKPVEAEGILKDLLLPEKKATELRKIRQLLGRTENVLDIRSRNAGKIAIEAASNLNIPSILQSAALQTDPTIRTTAVRYTYQLWQRDMQGGFSVLEHLTKKATTGLIPNFVSIESALGLSALIFFEYSRDQFVLERLHSIWRKVIADILRIREENSQWKEGLRRFIRERIVSFVTTVAFQLFRESPDYNFINYQGLEAFFHLGTAEKALYRNLIQYIDPEGSYSREQMEKDYLELIKIDNLLLAIIEQMGLVAQACHAPLTFLPFLKRLFEEAKENPVAYPYLSDITNVVVSILDLNPMLDEAFNFFVYAAEVCREYSARYPQTVRNSSSKAPGAMYLSSFIFNQYLRTGNVRTSWLETRIQTALAENNIAFFNLLLTTELPIVGIELRKPGAALDTLKLFFNNKNTEIGRIIQSFLARLRTHYPDKVDDFLEEEHASDDFRLQVRTNEPVETIGELIAVRSWHFLRDDVILNSPQLRSLLMHIFEKATNCKNARAWTDYFIREVVNLLYGGEVLHQPK
jgi:hypothetical protein